LRKFENVNTGMVLNEQELDELHTREYETMWNDKTHQLVDEFDTKEDFIKYMQERDVDTDFVEIEE